jgi:hypothetical protein
MRGIRNTTIAILALGLLAGPAVGVGAQDEEATTDAPVGPSYFTGQVFSDFEGTPFGSNGVLFEGDAIEVSDPRVSGSLTRAGTANFVNDVGDSAVISFQAGAWRIENDAGTWSGQGTGLLRVGPDGPPSVETSTVVLTGEGGYEGHTAYLIVDWATDDAAAVVGAVLVGDAPTAPELPAAE